MMACIRGIFVLLVCSAFTWVVEARPSKDSKKKDDLQLDLKGDLDWESKWWTPSEKDINDKKDSWKVFKNVKPSVRRWWEEDWNEDEWWAPKDNSNDISSKPTEVSTSDKKQGEGKTDLQTESTQAKVLEAAVPKEEPVQKEELAVPTEEPKKEDVKELPKEPLALPLVADPLPLVADTSKAQSMTSLKSSDKKDLDGKKPEAPVVEVPAAESPREKLSPVLAGETLSPFEDPKPGPVPGPRDEVHEHPADDKWEYHQHGGFGKYVEQGKEEQSEQKAADQKPGMSVEIDRAQVEAEIQREEDNRVVKIVEEDKSKVLDQFYGFGLEAGPAVPPSQKPEKEESKPEEVKKDEIKVVETKTEEPKKEDVLKKDLSVKDDVPVPANSKENYNEGVIYDTVPGAPVDRTHSVKKDLGNADYMKDVSTKSDLQTSPNPAPPGIDGKQATSEDTTPQAQTTKAEAAPLVELVKKVKTDYIKSKPLSMCKYDDECQSGRMCQNGVCICLPEKGCLGHYKPVCGSDGVQYLSHCELHRTACVNKVHIKIDHSGSCFVAHDKIDRMQKIQEIQTKKHRLPAVHKDKESTSTSTSDSKGSDSEEYDNDEYDYYEDNDTQSQSNDKADKADVSEKLAIDSKKIYDYSKHLKNTKEKAEEKTGKSADPAPWEHVQEETGKEFKGKGDKHIETKGLDQQDASYKECTKEELAKFKEQLVAFYCKRFEEPDCKLELREEREYLSTLMFSYFDKNTDYELDHAELEAKQKQEKFADFGTVCALTDLIWYDDTMNADGQLSLDEFIAAFNTRLFDGHQELVKTPLSAPVLHIIPTLATVGNGLELKCGVAADGTNVIWRKNGVNIRDLAMIELLVLDDGSLFFSKMGVHHMGNYSCEDPSEPSALQVHSLKVQMPPVVKVSLHSQIEPSQTDVTMHCHAEGVPKPTISWQINNVDLPSNPKHYVLTENSEMLTVHLTDYERDTGAYKCLAKNQAGTADDISTLFILGDKDKSVGMGYTYVNSGTFTVFHDKGYTAYDPDKCLKHRSVHGDFGYFKFIPDNLDQPLRLCEDGKDCSWGSVVNVKNSFLYVSQPTLNRVVVIETSKNWIPVQVISTDKQPMQVHYVEHLDQVWVLCWNGEADESTKTIVVVRDASKYVQHRAVHTQPVGNRFDQIQDLFIAKPNDLRHAFDYGYVTHNGQRGLTKIDLDNMRYTKTVDLTTYDCVPQSLAFVPIGGHIVVQCVSPLNHQTLQLVMDYITDAVVSTAVLAGKPYVSPDSRHVVTVDDFSGKVNVAGVNNEGTLEQAYEVTVSASISDVSFYPLSGHGYLLVLTSADDDNIITINLATGKVDKLRGTMKQDTSSDWHPSPVKRTIVSGDFFSDFLLAPSKSSISIVDAKFSKVQCEFTDAPRSKAAIFVGQQ